jgi:hypothetical protein
MASEETSVKIYRCDACPTVHYREDDALPSGFHGVASESVDDGTTDGALIVTASWYACRESHIRYAVVNALAKGAGQL